MSALKPGTTSRHEQVSGSLTGLAGRRLLVKVPSGQLQERAGVRWSTILPIGGMRARVDGCANRMVGGITETRMTRLTSGRATRRFLASVMLAWLAMSFATPLATGAGAGRDCPMAPSGGAPALIAGMDGGACEHTDVGPCLTTLGCVTAGPAIRSVAALFVSPARLTVLGAPPAPHLGDLYRTGPPTPPPNQI
mgnify:CR=1 FL=1